jgi:hypothetical protein
LFFLKALWKSSQKIHKKAFKKKVYKKVKAHLMDSLIQSPAIKIIQPQLSLNCHQSANQPTI